MKLYRYVQAILSVYHAAADKVECCFHVQRAGNCSMTQRQVLTVVATKIIFSTTVRLCLISC